MLFLNCLSWIKCLVYAPFQFWHVISMFACMLVGFRAELPLSASEFAFCRRWTPGASASNVGRCCLQRLTAQLLCLVSFSLHDALIFIVYMISVFTCMLSFLCKFSLAPLVHMLFFQASSCVFVPPRALYAAVPGVQQWTPVQLASNALVVLHAWHRLQIASF